MQSNLAKRLFDKRQFCFKRPASRGFRSLRAHSVAVSLSSQNTVSEQSFQLPWATAYQGSTVIVIERFSCDTSIQLNSTCALVVLDSTLHLRL